MNTVIYYPYVYPSPNWLKVAALCWDQVYRIKPRGLKDPEAIKELDEAFGTILKTIDAASVMMPKAPTAVKFDRWLQKRIKTFKTIPGKAKLKYISFYSQKVPSAMWNKLLQKGLAKKEEKKNRMSVSKWEAFGLLYPRNAPPGGFSKDELLKIVPEIEPYFLNTKDRESEEGYYKLLEDAEYAGYENDYEKFEKLKKKANDLYEKYMVTVRVPEVRTYLRQDVADHYLSLVASYVAKQRKLDLFAANGIYKDIIFHDTRSVAGKVATKALKAYLPKNLDKIETKKIADLREELATKRLEYQKAVQDLVKEYSSVASEGELNTIQGRIVDLAKQKIEDVKKTYKLNKTDTILKTFGVTFTPPAIATSIASLLGGYCQQFCVNSFWAISLKKGRLTLTFPTGFALQCNSAFKQMKAKSL